MNNHIINRGIFAALWLPTDERGQILKAELANNIAWLKSQGIHGFLALGSTGEFPYFSCEQRKDILSFVAEVAAPLPVIANISDISPLVVAELGRHAKQAGLAAISIMTPWFYQYSQENVLSHFLRAAESTDLPVFLYNFPELTGTRIDLETVAAFADRANMVGIKQSGGEFEYHKDLITLGREKGFVVFSGADVRLPEVFELGADGCIGGLANIAPELMLHIYRVCKEGSLGDFGEAARRLCTIVDHIVELPFPWSIGVAMSARGFPVGMPKIALSGKSQMMSSRAIISLRKCFDEWGIAPF